jgi:hypothetical protein
VLATVRVVIFGSRHAPWVVHGRVVSWGSEPALLTDLTSQLLRTAALQLYARRDRSCVIGRSDSS